jgi:hypothetical protein
MNRLFCKEPRGSIKGLLGMAALLLCSVACLALCFSQEKSIRESIDNNKIVNVVKSTYGRSFELKYMERNDIKKRLYICFHEDNGGVTPKMLNKIRLALNNYLKENPDYFINEGYQTTIEFRSVLTILYLTNGSSRFNGRYGGFNNIWVWHELFEECPQSSLSDLDAFSGIEGLQIGRQSISSTKSWNKFLSVLTKLNSLKYLCCDRGFSDSENQQVKAILPNCDLDHTYEYYNDDPLGPGE